MRWIYIAVMMLSAVVWAAEVSEQHNRDPKAAANAATQTAGSPAPAEQPKPAEALRQFGDAAVSRLVKVGDGFSFVCCVDLWPDVVGKDITVIIGKIEQPGELGDEGKSFYDKQLAKYLQERLESGSIELCNITRAADKFALVADVKVDGTYLAAELIKQGFAKAIEPPAPPASQPFRDPKTVGEPQTTADTGQTPPATPQSQQNPDQKAAGDQASAPIDAKDAVFVCSKNSELYHRTDCPSAKRISEKNAVYFKTVDEAIAAGKKPCSRCKP